MGRFSANQPLHLSRKPRMTDMKAGGKWWSPSDCARRDGTGTFFGLKKGRGAENIQNLLIRFVKFAIVQLDGHNPEELLNDHRRKGLEWRHPCQRVSAQAWRACFSHAEIPGLPVRNMIDQCVSMCFRIYVGLLDGWLETWHMSWIVMTCSSFLKGTPPVESSPCSGKMGVRKGVDLQNG